ncbi:hypothetical protein FB645_002693 [Coemansia sp. IMI 203386]|nr:hypothetical protein FB645_002693 [Coemansia sp. IMI 203386]
MDRFLVEKMKCMVCQEEQPIAQDCRKCKQSMGRYYCNKCRLIDDGPGKAIFHCDKCGICLSGDKSKFYHCETCDACVALSARTRHLCKEKQLHCDCPICGDQIFASTQAIVQTECRHLMHEKCLEKHVEYSFKCPVCLASICETNTFFRAIEKYMSVSTMPAEMADTEACANRRDELLTTKLWINDLKSQYLENVKSCAKDLPTDFERFPSSIHTYIDAYSNWYAENRDAIVAYRARQLLAERISGPSFVPSKNELKKLEMSVVEEERLLQQVQIRLSEKVHLANQKIDIENEGYQRATELSHQNEELVLDIRELEAELEEANRLLEEKEKREKDVVEQQTRELQATHNELVREIAMRDDMGRERDRLDERLKQLQSDEEKRRMNEVDSQEQQRLVDRWIRSIGPVVGAKVENNTLMLTLGEGVGPMSGRRVLVEFSVLGNVLSVRTDDGRELPPAFNHDTLMRLLNE